MDKPETNRESYTGKIEAHETVRQEATMQLNREMAEKILAAFDDPEVAEMNGAELQVRVTEGSWDGAVYFEDRKAGIWKGKLVGRAYNSCDEVSR
ncbi:hypothetical protein [Mangrovicoccus ximenensis]|uniref:hypothetical protein n=1 Tax=Mangrovicoccus ximenensis TaxID=1911570 RepID=UPI0011AE1DC6|nr:hypothetical protein [Mangrovicoccus ximenensis]